MSGFSDVAHACLLYENENQRKAVVLPFIREGIESGEACLFMAGADALDDWCLEFQAFGIDVKQEKDRGALVLFSAEDWRKSSQFNSLGQARTVWNFIESKLEGFSGVRITGDAQWAAIEPALSSDRLCHWEATADMLYRGEPVHTLCMYDSGKHAPSDLRAALRTHATVLTNGQFYANPHYEVDRILENEPYLNESAADRALIKDMLSRLAPAYVC